MSGLGGQTDVGINGKTECRVTSSAALVCHFFLRKANNQSGGGPPNSKKEQSWFGQFFDGTIVDLDRELPQGEGEHTFQVLTDKDRDALDVLRHSCAHIMARAVQRLFPGVQLAFGPTIENGFYYDMDSPTPIREDDFPRI